jgi:predicted phosphodiesterase
LDRTIALSDIHLGRDSSHAKSPEVLAPLFEGCRRVLLLGDIIDFWYLQHKQASHLEDRIRRICRAAGVKELIFFRGNHDACVGEAEEYALIDGVLYLHGHAVYHHLRGSGGMKARIETLNKRKFGPKRVASRSDHHVWRIVDHVYSSIPMAVLNPIAWPWPVVRRIRALVDEVAPHGGVKAVVLGHSHRPGMRHGNGLTLFNLGGWLRNTRACAFIREGRTVKLVHIDNHGKQLKWGKVLHEIQLHV